MPVYVYSPYNVVYEKKACEIRSKMTIITSSSFSSSYQSNSNNNNNNTMNE